MVDNPYQTPVPLNIPEAEPKVPLNLGPPDTPAVDPQQAQDLTWKAKAGLPNWGKPYEDVYNGFTSGIEDQMRNEAASHVGMEKAIEAQNNIIRNLGKPRLGPMDVTNAIANIAYSNEPTDPQTVFEKYYGKNYVNEFDRTGARNPDTFIPVANGEMPEYVDAIKDFGSTTVAQVEIAKRIYQKAHAKYEEQSTAGAIVDVLKNINPLYKNMKFRGVVDGNWFAGLGSNLLGSQLEDEISKLSSIRDINEYKRRLTEIVDTVGEDNPALAMEIAKAAVGRSVDEKSLDNGLDILDLTFAGQIGKGTFNIGRNLLMRQRIKNAVKDISKSALNDEPSTVSMRAGAGDAGDAGVASATDTIVKDLAGELNPAEEALNRVTSNVLYDGFQQTTYPSRNYRELATRLVDQYNNFTEAFKSTWRDSIKADRLASFLRVESNVRAMRENLRDSLPGVDNHILDISKPYKNEIGTGYNVDFHIGDKGATHFVDEEQASLWAKMHLRGMTYSIEGRADGVVSEGGMNYIKITKPLTETDDVIRDGLIVADYAKTPGVQKLLGNDGGSFGNHFTSFMGKWRTSEEILSLAQRIERKYVTYGPSVWYKLAKDESKYISDLAKGKIKTDPVTGERFTRWSGNQRLSSFGGGELSRQRRFSDWERLINFGKTEFNPETERRGYYFKTPGEIEDWYLQNIKRLPDDVELEAYFAYKRLNDLDHMHTNFRVYTNKHRVGTETHSIQAVDEAGKPIASPAFDGVRQNFIPRTGDTIAWFQENGTQPIYKVGSNTAWLRTKEYKELATDVKNGVYKVIRMYAPEEGELGSFGGIDTSNKRVVYTIAKNVDSKPIAFEQVPRQEGGHHIFDYDHYIKQANVLRETVGKDVRHIYLGDNTIMPVKIRAMGRDVAQKLDTIRQLLKAGDEAEARAFAKAKLPMSWEEIHGWFLPTKHVETGKLHPPLLNMDEKIQVIPANQRISDFSSELKNKYQSTWKDGTKSGSLANQYEVQFTGLRDNQGLRTVINKGTAKNPIYDWVEAKMLDPIPTMNRALSRVINSTFLDDYKVMSAEHWLQEAIEAGVLKAGKDEIRAAPFYHMSEPEYAKGIDKALLARFEATNYQIKQLWGVQSKYQQNLHSASQKLMDSIYGTFGEGRVLAIADWALPFAKDPLSIIRTMTFHAKLGFFAIPQLLVQAQTHFNILAIAGLRPAGAGTSASTLATWARINRTPAYLKALDAKLSGAGFGWKPGEWLEATTWLDRTGLANVQGEYSMLDTLLSTKIIKSGFQEFLDAGAFFFREGERSARQAAWYTAYHEFRNGGGGKLAFAGKTGRITEEDAKLILERADLLYGNMSRASSSALHTGVFKWTSQFLAYQIRLAEQMMGKRLTGWERARMVGVNAAMYGVPAATGLTGIPIIGDQIREWAINNGYVVGENWASSLAMEGLPAMLGALVSSTGGITDRLKTGNWFNVGPRLGNSGFEWIREIFRNDGSIWKVIGGAPFGFVANTIANADPFMKVMLNMVGGKFPASENDALDVFNEISQVSKTRKWLAALSYGSWNNNKGSKLEDVSPMKATFMAMTGLQDQAIDDIFHKANIKKSMDEMEKDAMTGFSREYRRFLQSVKDGNFEQATQYNTRAQYYLVFSQLPEQRKTRIIGRAMADKNNHDMISQSNWDFYVNSLNVPEEKRAMFQKAFRQIQQQQRTK